jgi:hypothetical protein
VNRHERLEKPAMIRQPQVQELVDDDEILKVARTFSQIFRERDSAFA